MGKERLRAPKKSSLRNLNQYKDMSDEEFDKEYQKLVNEYKTEIRTDEEIEQEIEERMEDFKEDYDLSDLKVNDRIVLRNLIQTIISLEDFERIFRDLRSDVSEDNMLLLDRISKIMNNLRRDISDMQEDLKITRKVRKESREDNFITWLDNIKDKAEDFYKRKMLYIFCPNCRELLATTWLLYPDEELNEIELKCNRCDNIVNQELKSLYSQKNKNIEGVKLP